jgi:hypothetical protein
MLAMCVLMVPGETNRSSPISPDRDRGTDQRVARHRGTDGFDQQGRARPFEDESVRAVAQSRVHVLIEVEGGHHDDPAWSLCVRARRRYAFPRPSSAAMVRESVERTMQRLGAAAHPM